MHVHDSVAAAVWRGNQETRVPRLLAMATLLAVFIPALFLRGVAQSLFVPLALAVAFAMIASYLDSLELKEYVPSEGTAGMSVFPRNLVIAAERVATLRYGENSHQLAAVYRRIGPIETSLATAQQLHGKELSYNNIGDGEAALELVREFAQPAAAIIKHANPCGVAVGETVAEAYRAALACDPDSAFGGVVACNRLLDKATAEQIAEVFTEVVIAPSFADDALDILRKKKNVRLLATGPFSGRSSEPMVRSFVGGFLVQDRDLGFVPREN